MKLQRSAASVSWGVGVNGVVALAPVAGGLGVAVLGLLSQLGGEHSLWATVRESIRARAGVRRQKLRNEARRDAYREAPAGAVLMERDDNGAQWVLVLPPKDTGPPPSLPDGLSLVTTDWFEQLTQASSSRQPDESRRPPENALAAPPAPAAAVTAQPAPPSDDAAAEAVTPTETRTATVRARTKRRRSRGRGRRGEG